MNVKYASLALGLLCLVGCAATPTGDYSAADCPIPPEQSADYLVGPGDTLNIVVWENPELSVTVPVRPDGRISTPLIDDMQASGKTPSQLSIDMEQVLAEYLRTPEVSVIVTGQGAANQIQVVGEVASPQSLSYRSGLKMLDVVVSVGGTTEFAAGNRANLVRPTVIGQVECRVRLKDLMGGDMTQNISVYPGDVLVVPETRF
jgi:polysaccharide export outer membrane protein